MALIIWTSIGIMVGFLLPFFKQINKKKTTLVLFASVIGSFVGGFIGRIITNEYASVYETHYVNFIFSISGAVIISLFLNSIVKTKRKLYKYN